jgi:hypothetical protein
VFDDRVVDGITIDDATLTNYKHGEKFDISSLTVELSFDNGEKINVSYGEFHSRSITLELLKNDSPVNIYDTPFIRWESALVEYKIKVSVGSHSDEAGLTINEADGVAIVDAPAADTVTQNTIKITAATLPQGAEQNIEYAIHTSDTIDAAYLSWNPANFNAATLTFSELSAGTIYYVYARSKENYNYNAGELKVSAPISTTNTANITITVADIVDEGYAVLEIDGEVQTTPFVIYRQGTPNQVTITLKNDIRPDTATYVIWKVPEVHESAPREFPRLYSESHDLTLHAADDDWWWFNSLGLKVITLEITIGGIPYSTRIEILVEEN